MRPGEVYTSLDGGKVLHFSLAVVSVLEAPLQLSKSQAQSPRQSKIHIDPFASPAPKCKRISKGRPSGTQKSRRIHLRIIRLGMQSGRWKMIGSKVGWGRELPRPGWSCLDSRLLQINPLLVRDFNQWTGLWRLGTPSSSQDRDTEIFLCDSR